jgi:hypothetical protein
MNTDKFNSIFLSVFICVHLWLNFFFAKTELAGAKAGQESLAPIDRDGSWRTPPPMIYCLSV